MKYISTRSKIKVSASQAIYDGLANDGGLYTFEHISSDFFNEEFYEMSHANILKKVLSYFLSDFHSQDIDRLVNITQSQLFQPKYFTMSHFAKLSVLNLYHGPTFSFKDMALTLLPSMLEMAKKNLNIHSKTVILTATSGDTGGAALSGFQALEQFDTWVLYPKHGVSEFQEKQMQSLASSKAHLIPIDGNFDDCQTLVKHAFSLPRTIHLSSANSINIGRIIAQIGYYLLSYIELVQTHVIQKNESINVVVPSGNFGNMYAAYVAKQLGVPFKDLIVASNQNDVLTELFLKGIYNKSRSFHVTMSPSMDILVSSNVERMIYDVIKDTTQVARLMQTLKEKGIVEIPLLKNTFFAYRASEVETKHAILSAYENLNHVIDPHTAVAYHAYQQHKSRDHTMIVSTASPYKFSDSVLKSLHQSVQTLTSNIDTLKTLMPWDSRMNRILDTTFDARVYSMEEAKKIIEKLVV